MGFQAAHDRLNGALGKAQFDSSMAGLLPRYGPVVSNVSTEAEEGDDPMSAPPGSPRWTVPQLFFTCSLLSFLFSSGSAAGLAWGYMLTPHGLQHCPGPGNPEPNEASRNASGTLGPTPVDETEEDSGSCFDALLQLHGRERPFEDLTGVKGHIRPPMWGKVREQSIWAYWYDPADCPSSQSCTMPDAIQLCVASIEKNRGSFDFHLVHMDTARNFVNMMELPLRWHLLQPVRQKETLMNALLARYGGVALDLSTVLLRPLDDLWRDMVDHRATFMGYMYRINGQPWGEPEATASWFLMSRREGIFSTAVRNQVVNYCDAHRFPDLALGDHTVTPVLGSINSSLPSCLDDDSVLHRDDCPDPTQPWPNLTDPDFYPPRTDRKVILLDPRDGPHLPFAHADNFGMGTWQTSNASGVPGLPPVCGSPSECWQKVVLPRYNSGSLHFIKLFRAGGELSLLSRKELLADKTTFFHGWLQLAGLDGARSAAKSKLHHV